MRGENPHENSSEGSPRLPEDTSLPLFIYGVLKPGMPAHQQIKPFILDNPEEMKILGQLYVRDGLPLLFDGEVCVQGFFVRLNPEHNQEAYQIVCNLEPEKLYEWGTVFTPSGRIANTRLGKYPQEGNPQPWVGKDGRPQSNWLLTDDPAFNEGMHTVREALEDISSAIGPWEKFYRAQMAYLLLWSILERLSALCCGPLENPLQRVKSLARLDGMSNLIKTHVERFNQRVSDSRDPQKIYRLKENNSHRSFLYYYQIRNNLSHRGKGAIREADKVQNSLVELLEITEGYLKRVKIQGG